MGEGEAAGSIERDALPLAVPGPGLQVAKEDVEAAVLQLHQVIEAVDRPAPPLVVDPPKVPDGRDPLPASPPDEREGPSLPVAGHFHRLGLV